MFILSFLTSGQACRSRVFGKLCHQVSSPAQAEEHYNRPTSPLQHPRPSAGTQLPQPLARTQLPRPSAAGMQHPRPSAAGMQHPRPSAAGTQLPRPSTAGTQLPQPSAAGTQLPRPSAARTQRPLTSVPATAYAVNSCSQVLQSLELSEQLQVLSILFSRISKQDVPSVCPVPSVSQQVGCKS